MAISDGVVYWYLRNWENAVEVQISLLLFVAFLGVVGWDIVKSLVFDIRLVITTFTGPHWRDPVRIFSRSCYFACRASGFIGNLLPVLYITMTHGECEGWRYAMLTPSIICNSTFSAVFACRCYVVSRRNKRYGIFLLAYLIGLSAFGAYVYLNFGKPLRVPFTKWCLWLAPTKGSKFVNLDHVYIALACVFDLVILLMTLHSLVEGGVVHFFLNIGTFIRNAFGIRRASDPELGWGVLSRHLVEQGVALYAIFELLRVILIIAMLVMPDYIMPVFIRAALQNGLNPVVVRMLLQGQAQYVKALPVSNHGSHPVTPRPVSSGFGVTGSGFEKTLDDMPMAMRAMRTSEAQVSRHEQPDKVVVHKGSDVQISATSWISAVTLDGRECLAHNGSHGGSAKSTGQHSNGGIGGSPGRPDSWERDDEADSYGRHQHPHHHPHQHNPYGVRP
ncbi:uncharacterized protein PFL1_02753 [Pseudozyma flocculosa PF-1]|uniref:Uncharacterized protein n=2 Tax=Pseudozyma flocculosa TaxID=84751 RepID=A0A5C3F0X3_9BASI|nr:uncharacterized protein PFL1_02753 [Pseudozyma flocculosa PF-1]EPQ29534.1 hypothetical protein PFL1_02753 [Pseudozyma flocculosa PF-1]SPO38078.1 uncharacterized protein PSFLO_03555 [Pseudozyma flocculosa]